MHQLQSASAAHSAGRYRQPKLRVHRLRFHHIALALVIGTLGCATSPLQAQELAAGGGHTCAVMPSGGATCWGWQEQGQSGDGSSNYNTGGLPVTVLGLTNASAIAAGYQHSCAIVGAGALKCWGYNRWGQLGNGNGSSSNAPVDVVGLIGASAVDAGDNHSCAIVDGNAWCWGHGYNGELGHGQFAESNLPVQVSGVSGATSIATGGNHACAVVANGAIKCWGRNNVGQLGNGSTTVDPGLNAPVDVTGLTHAVAVAAGSTFTCALIDDGTVQCWGHGGYGQLGIDGTDNSPAPVTVSNIDSAIALATGDYHACVLLEGGSAACWGYNYYGSIGDGTARNNRQLPASVLGVADATAITAGGSHSCARVSESPINVKCWGYGNFGQLGDAAFGGTHEVSTAVFVQSGPFDVIFGERPGSFEEP